MRNIEDVLLAILKTVAKREKQFTSNAVLAIAEARNLKLRDNRVIGTVMLRAEKEKLIIKTTEFVSSERELMHKCPKRVWRSLIYTERARIADTLPLFTGEAQSCAATI
jgi:hypothetical protein